MSLMTPCIWMSVKTVVRVLIILKLGSFRFDVSLCLLCRIFHASYGMPSKPGELPAFAENNAILMVFSVTGRLRSLF